jgi:hypothetical protein
MFHVPGMHTRRIEQHGEPVFSGQLLLSYCNPECRGKTPFSENETRPPASEKAPANTRTRAPSPLPASRRCIHCVVRPCLESLPLYLRNKEFVYEGEDIVGKSDNPKLKNERRSTRPGNSWNRINSGGLQAPMSVTGTVRSGCPKRRSQSHTDSAWRFLECQPSTLRNAWGPRIRVCTS